MRTCSFVLLSVFFLIGCNKDSTTESSAAILTGDYFPVSNSRIWTYSSNAMTDSGKSYITFEMTMDTSSYNKGVFLSLLGRFPGETKWNHMFAIKDSGGIVYSIGDNPPETPFPLFKHQYLSTEVVQETIIVNGTSYATVKVIFNVGNGRTSSWWFAKDIGLIKESSTQGVSIISDNNTSKNILIETILLSVK